MPSQHPEASASPHAEPLTQRFAEALQFTYELHHEQVRKNPERTPYLAHLMSVSALVVEHGGGEDDAIAGLLHDAIEDAGGASVEQEIAQRFGARVAELVRAVSDTDLEPKPPWRERKQAYLDHLAEVDEGVIRLSAADKLHNARQLLADYGRDGDLLWERFSAGRDDQLWIYGAYGDAFQRRLAELGASDGRTAELVAELRRVVGELTTAATGAPRATPAELLAQWGGALRALHDQKIVRTFNNPIADLAEALVYRALCPNETGTRGSFTQKAWDVQTAGGERIQVKAMRDTGAGKRRRNLSPIRSGASEWDTLVVVQFDEDLRVLRSFRMTADDAIAAARYSKHVRGHILSVTDDLLNSPTVQEFHIDDSWLHQPIVTATTDDA